MNFPTQDPRLLARGFGLFFFMLLCATLAYWATQWISPPQIQVTLVPMADDNAPRTSPAGNLFGQPGTASVIDDARLLGVVAIKDGTGIATIKIGSQPPRAFRAGAEVRNGIRVSEIHPGYIVLSGDGIRQQLNLPRRGAPLR